MDSFNVDDALDYLDKLIAKRIEVEKQLYNHSVKVLRSQHANVDINVRDIVDVGVDLAVTLKQYDNRIDILVNAIVNEIESRGAPGAAIANVNAKANRHYN